MIVHVVSFSPAADESSVGGFEWRYSLAEAKAEMLHQLSYEPSYATHNLSLVHLDIPTEHAASSDAVTEYIDSHLSLIEPQGTPR